MPGFILPRGSYNNLLSYRKAEAIFDITHCFCRRFLRKGDRTIDQMVQAARSGKQNIAEGAKAAAMSTEMEIKLTCVARSSLEELLLDYQDYLRVNGHQQWGKESKEALYVRKLGRQDDVSYEVYREICESRPAEVVANVAICVIRQAGYLLDQHVRRLEQDFLKTGGVRERMTRARTDARRNEKN